MSIERTTNNEIVIRIPSRAVDEHAMQGLIRYIKYLEATARSKAKQTDVDTLADEVTTSWWKKNKKRFTK